MLAMPSTIIGFIVISSGFKHLDVWERHDIYDDYVGMSTKLLYCTFTAYEIGFQISIVKVNQVSVFDTLFNS